MDTPEQDAEEAATDSVLEVVADAAPAPEAAVEATREEVDDAASPIMAKEEDSEVRCPCPPADVSDIVKNVF